MSERPCPHCGKPLKDGEVYRAGYELSNFRTIPPILGRGEYCDHVYLPGRCHVLTVTVAPDAVEDKTNLL